MNETVGQRVARLRGERRLTLAELAAASGLSGPGISRIESDGRNASLEALRALARPLGVTADYLEVGFDEVVVRAAVGRIDAAADQFGVGIGWHELDADERARVLSGLDVALIDAVAARVYAVRRRRAEAQPLAGAFGEAL